MGEQGRGKPEPLRPHRAAGTQAPAPWLPVRATIEDVGALQALQRGEAEPHQQRRSLEFIVNVVAEYYDLSYRPGPDGDRETVFAEGKRYVGAQIVKLLKSDPRLFNPERGD